MNLSRLDWRERDAHAGAVSLHKFLLALRRGDSLFAAQDIGRLAGAVLSDACVVLRYLGAQEQGDRLVILNLGRELSYEPCSEPLLAPLPEHLWVPLLSSEEIRFGGSGARFPFGENIGCRIPGQCALVMSSGGAPGGRTT